MFTKSRTDKFVEQAQDLAHDLSEAIAPHVERARDELGPRFADARDHVAPRIADARDQVAPRIAEARDQIAPLLADARDQVSPRVENARDAIVKDLVPKVQQAVSDVRDQAVPLAEEAQRRGEAAVAALKGQQPVKRKGRKRKILLFAALAGLAAFAAQKLRGRDESANWQTSYSPSPTPAAPAAPPSPAAPMAGTPAAEVAADATADGSDDPVGATPGESLSDATEEPHPVTTPDAPAEDVDVSEVPASPDKDA